jgi:glutamine synthetase
MNLEAIKKVIEEFEISLIDLKYSDLFGRWYHNTFPARRLEHVITSGIPFDGSSIPGLKSVESGDMVMLPDLATAHVDMFSEKPKLSIICSICDADSRKGVEKDPRSVSHRAHDYMKATGIADESLWIPELEFYLFDEAEFYGDNFEAGYRFSSVQNKKCLPYDYEDIDGLSSSDKKGYHMDVPFDKFAEVRDEMVDIMEEVGIKVRYHHHEVGLAAQQEIETELLEFPKIGDDAMIMKNVIRQVAYENNLSATFMPKPLYNEPGNGMHFHILLKKQGKNVFYKEGNYADLSDEAIYFIGGMLKHGRSLTALTNPSTNSFKRLLPGFEAPVKLFFGIANRSAAVRIPKYADKESNKRFEFRTGDATCNPYLAMSALLMAGLDGIKNKIDPRELNMGPYDDNVFNWSKEKQDKLVSIPTSLEEALDALEADHEYLLAGNVFGEDLIKTWIDYKRKEAKEVSNRPHPHEMMLYYNL